MNATFRRSATRWWLAACVTGFGFIGLSVATQSRADYEASSPYYGYDSGFATGSRIVYGCVGLVCVLLATRIIRLGIFASDAGLAIRNLVRTHHLPWPKVAGFERPARYGALRGTGLKIRLDDGSTLFAGLYSAGPLNRASFADAVLEELEALRLQAATSNQASDSPPPLGL